MLVVEREIAKNTLQTGGFGLNFCDEIMNYLKTIENWWA